MGYQNIGTIEYQGRTQTIYLPVGVPQADAWAMMKAQYFPDYTGPDPNFTVAPQTTEKVDLFK